MVTPPFLRALAETGVPLLCHCGPEYAVPVVKGGQSLGAPEYLRPALDAGVTVIVAHCAAPFYPTDGDDGLTQLEAMFAETRRAKKSWRLYADVSAFCVLCRVGVIDRLRRLPQDRLILGSDYPVPVNRMPLALWKRRRGRLSPRDERENPLDLNVRQLLAMDFSSSILTRAAQEVIPEDALRKTRRTIPRRRSS